jgi:hypothetical protein
MNRILFCAVAGLLTVASCTKDRISGSGSTITEDRNVSNFTKVSTSGSTNIHITNGPNFKVQVKGYENLIPYMETKLSNNTLEIGYKNNVNIKNDNVEVFVTLPALESVNTSGSAAIDVKGTFTGSTGLTASLSGSGNIDIEAGTAPFFKSSISGSGNIRAFGLLAQRADVSISGSGSTEVSAVNNLKVTISGSGTVYYKGQPVVETSISGSGQVVHR